MAGLMVVGVDGSADSLSALTVAARLAQESHNALVVVYVRPYTVACLAGLASEGAEVALVDALDATEKTVRHAVANVMAGYSVLWSMEVVAGDPANELIETARRQEAQAIVVGGRNHGVIGGIVSSSVAQKLVRQSPVSVWVVRDHATTQIRPEVNAPSS